MHVFVVYPESFTFQNRVSFMETKCKLQVKKACSCIQNILVEAGKVASAFNREISESAEKEVLEQLKADGCNVVEVTDITPWQEATKAVIEENTKGQEELYQKILDMQ